ncbi:MAG: hypothetical protein R3A10_09255 [Caldilineaceae bacterium]
MIKAGRTAAAARAAASHTGSLAGSDEVLDAAWRSGVLRAERISDLFTRPRCWPSSPGPTVPGRPSSPRGGPGVLATDARSRAAAGSRN